jgi:hypothetical protein
MLTIDTCAILFQTRTAAEKVRYLGELSWCRKMPSLILTLENTN